MRAIGLHMRFSGAFSSVIERASVLSLPLFQTFFKNGSTNRYIQVTAELVKQFDKVRGQFSHVIAHGSYTINLAHPEVTTFYSLKKEFSRAEQLQFSHLVFHPGAVVGEQTREEGLDTIARNLNILTKRERGFSVVLENSAHGKRSLGGDIEDLAYIQARLDRSEKVSFCIDTAHAHVFGYAMKDDPDTFVNMVCRTLSHEAISLIHANDTHELCGSCIDKHCIPGQGQLGKEVLKHVVNHPLLHKVPVILELPQLSDEQELKVLKDVRSWW